jgi:integrase
MVMLKIPFIVKQVSKGREYFYFRRGKTYVRVPAPTDPTFQAKYQKLVRQNDVIPRAPQIPGSFGALVESFLACTAYKALTKKVQYEYRRQLDVMKAKWGDLPVSRLTRKGVMAYRDTFENKPRAAYAAMQVLRRLLNYAIDQGLITVNPALRPGRNKSKQFKAWTAEDLKAFRDANATKYPDMVLAMEIGAFTGQRRGDVIGMTEKDYNGRRIAVCQNKTGERVWVPVHSVLKAALDARKTRHMVLLTSKQGKAFKETHFSHRFKKAVDNAGLTGLSFHGLRATASIMLAEAGCSDAEIQSITGHVTSAMAAYYRRQADKQKTAEAAILKLERKQAEV